MKEKQKKKVLFIISVTIIGVIAILLVPVIFHAIL